jgi:hypothetical protein
MRASVSLWVLNLCVCVCRCVAAVLLRVAEAVSTILAAYHPCRLSLGWVCTQLGFGDDQEEEVGRVFVWRAGAGLCSA